MSTRAMYSFLEATDAPLNVYVHHDGYPSGALQKIKETIDAENAWQLPRFEADEFAAAFVAVNKKNEGGVRLMPSGAWKKVAPLDLAYRYEIYHSGNSKTVNVKAYAVDASWTTHRFTQQLLFNLPLEDAIAQIEAEEAAK